MWHFVFLCQTFEKPNTDQLKRNWAFAIADIVSALFGIDPNGVPLTRKHIQQSKKGCKDQKSIRSSTIPDPGYQWESDEFTVRQPRGLENKNIPR